MGLRHVAEKAAANNRPNPEYIHQETLARVQADEELRQQKCCLGSPIIAALGLQSVFRQLSDVTHLWAVVHRAANPHFTMKLHRCAVPESYLRQFQLN